MLDETRRGWRDPDLVPLFVEVSQAAPAVAGPVAAPDTVPMQQSLENMRRELSK
jgi:hypothetical protein